jgi:hypothetical protein
MEENMSECEGLIVDALSNLRSHAPAKAVWRLVDAVGLLIERHQLQDEVGAGQCTGRGWQIIRKRRNLPGKEEKS